MYAGQMLKPPAPVAWAAYATAMLLNPNNHALDGGPATAELEREAVEQLRVMLGVPAPGLGHLTSSGTVANLEALWVARELTGGATVLSSADSHYTHARMCGVLGVDHEAVATDDRGRMDLDALADRLGRGGVGTVVATVGTTSLGALDDTGGHRRPVRRARRPAARGHRLRRLLRAAGRRRRARRGPGPLRRHRPRRLGGDRPAQARAPALRLRLRAVRRPRRGPPVRARLALHLLHLARPAPGRDQPGVLTRGRVGRRAVDHAAGAAADPRGPGRRPGRLPRRGAGAGGPAARRRAPRAGGRARAGHRLRARPGRATPSAPSPRWPRTAGTWRRCGPIRERRCAAACSSPSTWAWSTSWPRPSPRRCAQSS